MISDIITFLQEDKIILHPTDRFVEKVVMQHPKMLLKKFMNSKNRVESKSLIMLLNSIEMLLTYIPKIPSEVLKVLEEATSPTTIIYSNPKGLATNAIAKVLLLTK